MKSKKLNDNNDADSAIVPDVSPELVNECLAANERGDGVLYATINRGRFVFNTTPKEGEWMAWNGCVWQPDHTRRSLDAVEQVAMAYQGEHSRLTEEIREQGVKKDSPDAWKLRVAADLKARVNRLRSVNGATKVLTWAPVVDTGMSCRESDLDRQPWLLPVKNGVVNLRTGVLERGVPGDMLTRALDLEYDQHADYQAWNDFVAEVSGSEEVAGFVKRSLGYAITGHSYEQYIWVFVGPGRNGKGVLFSMVGDVMRPYYHEISRGMLLEQRSEPSPSASSEHKYSLLGKRIIVGAETNRGQRIDAAAVKGLTGEDAITCRPNFGSEISFLPTHTLFLHTNHVPVGLTRDFALVQRLLRIEFPNMYVDDPAAEGRKYPGQRDRFRVKDPLLKDKLRACRPGILRWLIEGCLEWQDMGLAPPAAIIEGVNKLQAEEDYVQQFHADCLEMPENPSPGLRLSCTEMYAAFKWWWAQNMDTREQRVPSMKSVNMSLRDRGYVVEKAGGKTYLYDHILAPECLPDVLQYTEKSTSP